MVDPSIPPIAHTGTAQVESPVISPFSLVGRGRMLFSSVLSVPIRWLKRVLSHPFFLDINVDEAEALHYQGTDRLVIRVLWGYFLALLLLVWLDAGVRLPDYYPSPFGWRAINSLEGSLALGLALFLTVGMVRLAGKLANHYLWRIMLTIVLTIYSYLFVFVSGGAIEMHFNFFIVMAFLVSYADWRLGWWVFFLTTIAHGVMDFFAPSWVYFYGRNDLAMPVHAIILLSMAVFTTILARNYRETVMALQMAKRRNDEFLAIASHELKTPLTSIKGYTQVLQHRLRLTPDKTASGYIHKINDQLNRIIGLVRDLLDVSKIQSGQVEFKSERISIDGLLLEAVEEVQGLSPNHTLRLEGRAYTAVIGDRTRLYQVLLNLLTNAVKYSPHHQLVIIRVIETRDRIVISVQDFGIGIAKKDQVRIFEPYFRSAESEREDLPGGLGMGLFICTEIIKRHHGKLWVESEEGQGSTFSFMLPLGREARV
jgi:signal transduction histidine kinase